MSIHLLGSNKGLPWCVTEMLGDKKVIHWRTNSEAAAKIMASQFNCTWLKNRKLTVEKIENETV